MIFALWERATPNETALGKGFRTRECFCTRADASPSRNIALPQHTAPLDLRICFERCGRWSSARQQSRRSVRRCSLPTRLRQNVCVVPRILNHCTIEWRDPTWISLSHQQVGCLPMDWPCELLDLCACRGRAHPLCLALTRPGDLHRGRFRCEGMAASARAFLLFSPPTYHGVGTQPCSVCPRQRGPKNGDRAGAEAQSRREVERGW